MEENRDLLQAILEDPDADAPRLIYADWLEEQADPRAAFIRVQCQLASLGADGPARVELAQREGTLLQQHERTWLGPVRRLVSGYEFRRGFVETVTLEGRAFIQHADELFHTIPLRQARLLSAANVIADLAECRFLGRLTGL